MDSHVIPARNASANVDSDAAVVPAGRSFCCVRATRQVHLTPKYGDGSDREVAVRYLWVGAPGAPTVVVQGGISADRQVCHTDDDPAPGWWNELVGPHKAIDLNRVRVLAIDWLTATDVGAPAISSDDQADAIEQLMNELGIRSLAAFVGASYGAMTALAFGVRYADRVGKLVVLAGAHRSHPLSTALRSIQRNILRLGLDNGCADEAVSLARQLAMTTYRGANEFSARFSGAPEWHEGHWQLPVESWLEHVGGKFASGFDAERYLSLSESIDLHRVDPAQVHVATALIGFASDRLVPLSDLCDLQRGMGAHASLDVIDTPYGHDGFLKEAAQLTPLLSAAIDPVAV